MAVRKLSPGKIVILLLGVVFLLGVSTVALVGKHLTPSPYACQTQTMQNIPDMAGAHLIVSRTSCQDYTHKRFVSVYVQRYVAPRALFFKYWFNSPVLLFRYHPESWTAPLPALKQTGSHAVQISVPRISRIDDRRHQWLGLTIHYNIGHIDHPLVAGHD